MVLSYQMLYKGAVSPRSPTYSDKRCTQNLLWLGHLYSVDTRPRACLYNIVIPISPCLVIGPAWIFRMSIRACSLGKEISVKYKQFWCNLTRAKQSQMMLVERANHSYCHRIISFHLAQVWPVIFVGEMLCEEPRNLWLKEPVTHCSLN